MGCKKLNKARLKPPENLDEGQFIKCQLMQKKPKRWEEPQKMAFGQIITKISQPFGDPLTKRTPLHGTHFHPKLLEEMKRQREENQS